ncbi:MAG: PAS domain S-box protein, partial [Bacteroidia bacterium]|nr:PAS domain S-box protein [Bacteroidia bacterium]
MDIQDKTREELLIELEELQKAHDFLKCTLEAEFQDRKNTEDALRRSEDHLTITLHSIGDAVLSTDKEGLVVQMNPVAEELCGWQLSEAIGKPLSDVFFIVNAETRKPVADPVKKVLELGEIVGLANHTVLISRNGAEFHISDSAAPIKNKEDEISGVVLVFSDVTENYTAQMLIKENEQRYRSLLNNLEAGIVVHAPDTSIVMNNFRASELLGLTEDQMRGKEAIDPAWNFIDEDLKPMPLNEYPVNRILNQRKPLQNQILGIHQPGKEELVWVTVNGFPVIDNQGEFVEIVISFIDITDSKNAEKTIKQRERELRRHNELFDSLINNLPIGVFMVEVPSGKPLIANESALRLLGRGILPSASKHNLAEVYQAFKKDTGQPYPLEEMPIVQGMNGVTSYIDDMIILRPDGSKTNVEIFGSPVKDDEG